MKIALIGDTHLGSRRGSDIFDNYFRKCFSEFIFPLLQKENVSEVIQFGDMFDDRKAVSTKSITLSKEYFFDPMSNLGLKMHTLLGNHDLFYRESLSVASQKEFLSEYENINIIDKPQEINVDGFNISLIPWICKENREEVFEYIKNSTTTIIGGHFEIEGFQMYKGVKSRGGLSPTVFKKFDRVWSGHYHTKSTSNNISYLGTPYELTWQDCNDPRGIHIFNTITGEIEFFENPFKLFRKIEYNNELEFNVGDYKDTFVKVYVLEKESQIEFDKFITKLYDVGAHSVVIIEDLSEFKETSDIDDEEVEINIENTTDIINRYIDSIDTDKDKEKIKDYMQKLYLEAINKE